MKKKILISTATALVLAISAYAIAARNGHGRNSDANGPHHMIEYLDKHLDLSTDQRERIDAIFTEKFAQRQAQHDEHMAKIQELIRQDTLTVADVRSAMATFRGPQAGHHENHADIIVAVHAVLTPEQRNKAAELIGENKHHGFGRGRGHHDGNGRHHNRGRHHRY